MTPYSYEALVAIFCYLYAINADDIASALDQLADRSIADKAIQRSSSLHLARKISVTEL